MNLNENERKVLLFFADQYEEYYYPFDTISADTKLDRKQVRAACRSLRERGLTEFSSTLWSEEGKPAGSGYRATKAGMAIIAEQREVK